MGTTKLVFDAQLTHNLNCYLPEHYHTVGGSVSVRCLSKIHSCRVITVLTLPVKVLTLN